MNHTVKIQCICCNSSELFGDCPLCENQRHFVYEIKGEIDDFMKDFYDETIIDSKFYNQTDEVKKEQLDDELSRYFDL